MGRAEAWRWKLMQRLNAYLHNGEHGNAEADMALEKQVSILYPDP